MRKVRLIQIGNVVSTLLSNTTITLQKIQRGFDFDLYNTTIKLKKKNPKLGYSDAYIYSEIYMYMKKEESNDYPIAITDEMLYDELISVSDQSGAMISMYPFKHLSDDDKAKYLLYTIASILPDIKQQVTDIHRETRGCPNDYCENPDDMKIGVLKGAYCKACYRSLLEAIENGHLSYQELASIHRILDYVADTKICFVIMPFRKKFNRVYAAIKNTVVDAGYDCYRSDEVFETRNIIQLINERIIRADLVIADLTNKNPNVFYELGIAHAYGKNTIILSQKMSDIPFDLKHRQRVLYKISPNFDKNIKIKLTKYLK